MQTVARPRAVPADVERIREAIGRGPTRRTVVRSTAWSVPMIAAATAAPAFALSPSVCTACTGSAPTSCFIPVVIGDPLPPGACQCADGLVCASVGPLGLLNVCVATNLVATSCGATTCRGICVAAGGGLIVAVNTLVTTLTGPLAALNALLGCSAGITGSIPGNICVVPVTDPNAGTFGALCISNAGTGAIAVTATTAVTVLKSTVAGLGIGGLVFANQCAVPFSCQPGVKATASGAGCLGQSLNLTVGFCKC